jgi:hypothetical protein
VLSASQQFKDSLRTSHVVAIAAEVVQPGQAAVAVPVEGGSLTIDRTSRTRRTGSVQVPMTLDFDVRTLPFGSYVRLKRGVHYADGSREYATIAYLRVESIGWQTHEDTCSLELADRMAQVANEPLLTPYAPTGLKPSAAAIALVTDVFGTTITYTSTVPAASEPALADVVYSGDRAQAVADLAQAVGAQAFFDADGNFRFDPLPTLNEQAVWTIDAGADGVMVAADESLDRTSVYNGVLVQGQPASDQPPVYALVVDNNPLSRTLWGGPFGKVARVESSTAVQTTQQATDVGTALLNNQLGLGRQVAISSVPNPLLVAGDTLSVVFPDDRSELHLIEQHRLPLDVRSPSQMVSRSVWSPNPAALSEPALRSYVGAEAWRELAGAEAV